MASGRRRGEIVSHGLIVAALASAAYLAEWAQEIDLLKQWSVAIHVALLFVVIAAVFLAVFLLETYLERAARQQPIHIDRVGLVDGYWIEGVWKIEGDGWTLIGGSVVHIESTGGEGFEVEGEYYEGRDAGRRSGHFTGTGYLAGPGFVYTYTGGEGAALDRGVGFREFRRSIVGREKVRLEGFFIAAASGATRRVAGRKLAKEEEAKLHSDDEPALLREFLGRLSDERGMPVQAK